MDEERQRMRHFDANSTDYQSDEPGRTIKSTRKFGVEVEMVYGRSSQVEILSDEIPHSFGVEHDGSIRAPGGGGIEIVSPILSGRAGEDIIRDLFKKINKQGFKINSSCGLHVHLDGAGFKNKKEVVSTTVSKTDSSMLRSLKRGDSVVIVKRSLMDAITKAAEEDKTAVAEMLVEEYATTGKPQLFMSKAFGVHVPDIVVRVETIKVGSKKFQLDYFAPVEDLGINEETEVVFDVHQFGVANKDYFFVIKQNTALDNVKTLLYLYCVYNDVFMSMLPKSRREMNAYCQSLGLAFSANQIEAIRSYNELEKEWYKTRDMMETAMRKGNNYDDSRYYGVNLHSLFAKYGTIEMRAHSATLEPNKVLYWVALHQEILDKIVNGELTIGNLRKGAHIFNIKDKTTFLINTLSLRTSLRKYMLQRIEHFSEDKTNAK